jgi:rhodanese-related sulfurtransferase/TusA-related sulfurtransferase
MSVKADVQLDAKGLACPMPIVRTKKAMNQLEDGQILEIQATDKGTTADLSAWAESVGHQYIGTTDDANVLYHYIRKGSSDAMTTEGSYEPTISINEVAERAAQGGLIVDVREEAEYAFGHIEGAKSIPMGELDARMNELSKDKPIYVICRTGKRSELSAQKLVKAGFSNVFNVVPGMTAWNGPVSKNV